MTTREELVALVAKAHQDAPYAEASETGKLLAAESKLPKLVAQNLGAGFGQWNFFPEAADIVDFALAYVPPADETAMMELARKWASDDAHDRHTILNLVGKEILTHELKRLDVPKLKELVEATRGTRALEARKALGFEVPAGAEAPAKPARAPRARKEPTPGREIPLKMPKPQFVKPAPKAPPPPPRKFTHPKFGEGTLEKSEGAGEDMKLTVKFSTGTKTLLAKFLTEIPT
jgi:hypothetical protein